MWGEHRLRGKIFRSRMYVLLTVMFFVSMGSVYAVNYDGDPSTVATEVKVKNILVVNKQIPLPATYKPSVVEVSGHKATKETFDAFDKLKKEAKNSKAYDFTVVSGYKSYDSQKSIYTNAVKEQGEDGVDKTITRPGFSEHQTGLVLDVLGGKSTSLTTDFGETVEGKWLAENAYKYGFILRYPKGKEDITGNAYEPWHLRFIGVDEAKKYKESGKETLEDYLGISGKTAKQLDSSSTDNGAVTAGEDTEGTGSGGKDDVGYIEGNGKAEGFKPFRNHKITSTIVGTDNSQSSIPTEASYGGSELAKLLYKGMQFLMVLLSLGLVLYVSLQISMLAVTSKTGGTGTKAGQKAERILFGADGLGEGRVARVLKSVLLMTVILTFTLGSYYVYVQALIYKVLADILYFIF